jgi:hypothetical protein
MANAKQLYIKYENGIVPIDPAIAEKYNLRAGTMSPFSGGLIIDMDESPKESEPKKPKVRGREETIGELVNDGIAQLDNGMTLSHSEMIDIAEAADSKNE